MPRLPASSGSGTRFDMKNVRGFLRKGSEYLHPSTPESHYVSLEDGNNMPA